MTKIQNTLGNYEFIINTDMFSDFLFFFFFWSWHFILGLIQFCLVPWGDPEGSGREGGERGDQDGEYMWIYGWFMSMYGKKSL